MKHFKVCMIESSPKEITALLHAWQEGQDEAFPALLEQVLADLKRMALRYLAREPPDHTLQPTALVHEVYLRLELHELQPFSDRSEFFGFAARLMREILVDHARAKRRLKRGGGLWRVPLESALDRSHDQPLDPETILAVDEAVTRLTRLDPRQGKVVELRYFVGLTIPEIARVLEVGRATVERDWAVAKRWLGRELAPAAEGPRSGCQRDAEGAEGVGGAVTKRCRSTSNSCAEP